MIGVRPPLVKRIAGILYPDPKDGGPSSEELFDWTLRELTRLWGEPDLVSGPVPFDKTDYYRDIAPCLLRRFVCFPFLVDAGGLADWKHQSHELEEASARLVGRPLRGVNIDPGYIDGARLILASTKDHAHRIWLRDGIYAEVTLRWRFGKWVSFDYTFPDFKSGVYDDFLSAVRRMWLDEKNTAKRTELSQN
ncbi:MAG: DUF4416 family protein [Fretibacterium sp.]|nr:DUF4416 family protein [Fretibacterium sp.]